MPAKLLSEPSRENPELLIKWNVVKTQTIGKRQQSFAFVCACAGSIDFAFSGNFSHHKNFFQSFHPKFQSSAIFPFVHFGSERFAWNFQQFFFARVSKPSRGLCNRNLIASLKSKELKLGKFGVKVFCAEVFHSHIEGLKIIKTLKWITNSFSPSKLTTATSFTWAHAETWPLTVSRPSRQWTCWRQVISRHANDPLIKLWKWELKRMTAPPIAFAINHRPIQTNIAEFIICCVCVKIFPITFAPTAKWRL